MNTSNAVCPDREIRASFDDERVTVYQAYGVEVGLTALAAGRFVPPFKRDRMTWIKPSFLWMMYRSGWATKPGQEHVLAIDISRRGFEWALSNACLSSFDPRVYQSAAQWEEIKACSPVRVQWDPERDLRLAPLGHRAIQIGLSGEAVRRYVEDWTLDIRDVTDQARRISAAVVADEVEWALTELPVEMPYPLADALKVRLGAS